MKISNNALLFNLKPNIALEIKRTNGLSSICYYRPPEDVLIRYNGETYFNQPIKLDSNSGIDFDIELEYYINGDFKKHTFTRSSIHILRYEHEHYDYLELCDYKNTLIFNLKNYREDNKINFSNIKHLKSKPEFVGSDYIVYYHNRTKKVVDELIRINNTDNKMDLTTIYESVQKGTMNFNEFNYMMEGK